MPETNETSVGTIIRANTLPVANEQVCVGNIMETDVVSVKEDDTLFDAAWKLAVNSISGAPVLDTGNRLVGIISDGDILRYLNVYNPSTGGVCPLDPTNCFKVCEQDPGIISIEPAQATDLYDAFDRAKATRVHEIMVRDVITVSADDHVEKVSSMLVTNNIKRMPVQGDGGRVLGMVGMKDLVMYVVKRKRANELLELTRNG